LGSFLWPRPIPLIPRLSPLGLVSRFSHPRFPPSHLPTRSEPIPNS
jgi:hypothetical protein